MYFCALQSLRIKRVSQTQFLKPVNKTALGLAPLPYLFDQNMSELSQELLNSSCLFFLLRVLCVHNKARIWCLRMNINGAGISLVCSLFITKTPKSPNSSPVQIPYSAESSSELLCLVLNSEGPDDPKLPTGLSPTFKGTYGADTTSRAAPLPASFLPLTVRRRQSF